MSIVSLLVALNHPLEVIRIDNFATNLGLDGARLGNYLVVLFVPARMLNYVWRVLEGAGYEVELSEEL